MSYDEAFKVGSKVDGYIKCTFTQIHDAAGNLLFSMQKEGFSKSQSLYDVDSFVQRISGDVFAADPNANFEIVTEFPLLQATLHRPGAEYVPCLFTTEAARFIQSKLKALYRTKYYVYRLYLTKYKDDGHTYQAGERRLMAESYGNPHVEKYKDTIHYIHKLETGKVEQEHYAELLNGLENYKSFVVYVQPKHVDWIPTKIDNIMINGVNLNDAIEEARRKVESAKNVLIAAGAASLII